MHFEEIVTDGLRDTLRRNGYHVLLGNSEFGPEDEEALVTEFLSRRVDGAYLTGSTHTEHTRQMLRENSVPTVKIASLPQDPVDMAVGFLLAQVEATISLSGRRFAASGPENQSPPEKTLLSV
ncbi:DNA-binding LacI/PurR family transcriptional regulator [Phyllobacterium sp. 1468]|uniref:hypothetical protein n=1 Tax=Phyllobacterium sp. 1468 TaxID=2817759 RepID=UPI001AE4CC18|nr:hypothetical protein [Phyllobacterium sp. 1468]MDR6636186.1 DNA-binding LacI/PurR family transcriptional regulator [Phyllobacterium sp. 1468]